MSKVIKLREIGNSRGVVLPKEMLDRLRISLGDELYLIPTRDGFKITPYDPEFGEQMELAEEIMRDRKNVLRKLSE